MQLNRKLANEFYADILSDARRDNCVPKAMASLGKRDLWFLMVRLMGRTDMNGRPGIDPDWLYDRCREIQYEPDGYLDIWAREHYKSTIITFGKTVQDILIDPERTFGIFSVKRELAQDFLKQIKEEFQNNELLKKLYSDILYDNPEKESPCWGIDKGIRVKRTRNSREETVEAWGLINGMPTGKHFTHNIYDDVVTEKSVTNPDQLTKTYDQLRLSFSLGSHGGARRMIGTFYHYNDAWRSVIKAESAIPRKHAATLNGKADGEPAFLTKESLRQKRKDQGPYIYGCQMLLDPTADKAQGFKEEWLKYYHNMDSLKNGDFNIYILVDPAGEKKKQQNKDPDYTVFVVIGLGSDGNYYLLDGYWGRLNLAERTSMMFRLHRKWKPLDVGYEKFGKDSDIEHIEMEMERNNYRFEITVLSSPTPKNDRIRKLVPVFEQGRFYLPVSLMYVDEEDKVQDFIAIFKDNEYFAFPVGSHDDIFDDMAWIVSEQLDAEFPENTARLPLGMPGQNHNIEEIDCMEGYN